LSRVERKPQVFPYPKRFYLGIPQPMHDFYIRAWRSYLNERIKSDDSYARKFLNGVEEMDKKVGGTVQKVEAFKKDFYARVRQREEKIWGK